MGFVLALARQTATGDVTTADDLGLGHTTANEENVLTVTHLWYCAAEEAEAEEVEEIEEVAVNWNLLETRGG